MTPPTTLPGDPLRNSSGKPIILPSQSRTIISSSMQAGAAAQLNPTQPIESLSMSARMLG